MLANYFPVLVFLCIAVCLAFVPLFATRLLIQKRVTPMKEAPYECGFPAKGDAHVPFNIRYYLVALLFIIFDLETAFLFPWAVALREIPWFGFFSALLFLLILTVGFIYEWKTGALTWE